VTTQSFSHGTTSFQEIRHRFTDLHPFLDKFIWHVWPTACGTSCTSCCTIRKTWVFTFEFAEETEVGTRWEKQSGFSCAGEHVGCRTKYKGAAYKVIPKKITILCKLKLSIYIYIYMFATHLSIPIKSGMSICLILFKILLSIMKP